MNNNQHLIRQQARLQRLIEFQHINDGKLPTKRAAMILFNCNYNSVNQLVEMLAQNKGISVQFLPLISLPLPCNWYYRQGVLGN